MLAQPILLARAREGHEEEVGARRGDGGDDLVVILPVAVPCADDIQLRMAGEEAREHLVEHVLCGAEEVDGVPRHLCALENRREEVDPRHALGKRPAQQAACPDDR